jgi:FkbM family methyltransferase
VIAYHRYLYLLRHPRLARRKASELLGRSDPVTNLADEAHRLERALRDVNKRLLERGSGSPTGRAFVLLDYPKADIRLSVRAPKRRNVAMGKEPFTVTWLERELQTGDVFYDIGANIGAYALMAARVGGPTVRAVAFEPGAETFGVLCENIVLNDAAEQIVPLPVVLGAKTTLGLFRYSDLRAGAAMHDSTGAVTNDFVYTQPVLQFRLDDLVRQFSLPLPTLVKLDVDGAEAAVLEGAAETLRSAPTRSLMVELGRESSVLGELVARLGFRSAETYTRPKGKAQYGLFERSE